MTDPMTQISQHSFNVGDIVELKSGSPKMTVEEVRVDGNLSHVSCVWFDNEKVFRDNFTNFALNKILNEAKTRDVIGR